MVVDRQPTARLDAPTAPASRSGAAQLEMQVRCTQRDVDAAAALHRQRAVEIERRIVLHAAGLERQYGLDKSFGSERLDDALAIADDGAEVVESIRAHGTDRICRCRRRYRTSAR